MRIASSGRWLRVELGGAYRLLSWAPSGGGFTRVRRVAVLYLAPDELATVGDPRRWLRARMREAGITEAAAMMTSRSGGRYTSASHGGRCHAVATVGLSNALAAGDAATLQGESRTINLLCVLTKAVSRGAMVEAVALAAEARTAAVLESGVTSRVSGRPATGTGTDCIAVACPDRRAEDMYCGKHTALGESIGRAVRQAVAAGVAEWMREYAA